MRRTMMDLSLNIDVFFSGKNRRKFTTLLLAVLFPVLFLSAQKKTAIIQCTDDPAKWVMIDTNGLEIHRIYALGESPDRFNEGLIRIIQNDQIGFVNRKGQVIIPPVYCQATVFFKGKSIVNVNATKIDNSTTDAQHFTLWEGGTWGVINKKGRIVKPFDYTRFWNDSLEMYQYEKEGEVFKLY